MSKPLKRYEYVGPEDLLELTESEPAGSSISALSDIEQWAEKTDQFASDPVVATYIIDTTGRLRIADRHCEHVACASGRPVLAAGEITFEGFGSNLEVVEITNQSTAYCPEPTCWTVVEKALAAIGIPHPDGFTTEFIFRRCESCGTVNIIKDDWYSCAVCEKELPE